MRANGREIAVPKVSRLFASIHGWKFVSRDGAYAALAGGISR